MNKSTAISLLLLLLGGGFLAYRAATVGMGSGYVRELQPAVDADAPEPAEGEPAARSPRIVAADPRERNEADVYFSWSRTIGIWVAALCTLGILSFLYGDNVFYKLAESVFVGASAAYWMVVAFWTGIVEKLLGNLTPWLMRQWALPGLSSEAKADWIYLAPLVLGIMLLWRLAPAGGWISRWPLAFFIGATAGFRLVTFLHVDFVGQIHNTIIPLVALAGDRSIDPWSSLKNLTIFVGVLSCLVYFFFSVEHTGVFGGTARLGIWFLMITFGAGFGYTVMGRIALLAERLEFLFDDWLWIIDPMGRRLGL